MQHTLNQVFDALRLSRLAVAIQHGFVAVLIFCVGIFLVASFPSCKIASKQFREEPGTQKSGEEKAADTSAPGCDVVIHDVSSISHIYLVKLIGWIFNAYLTEFTAYHLFLHILWRLSYSITPLGTNI